MSDFRIRDSASADREAPREHAALEARRSTRKAIWRRAVVTNEALLFRYSALIFNAHRIHYDQPYCVKEGYPGVIVHGPLIATMLADLVRRNTDGDEVPSRPAFPAPRSH